MTGPLRNLTTMILAVLLLTWGVGCCSDTDTISFRIDAHLDDSVKNPNTDTFDPVTVELVGVNPSGYETWNQYSMTQYFENVNSHDDPMVFRMSLGNKRTDSEKAQTLIKEDPIWELWKKEGVTHIFVMSSYPRTGDDRPGSADARRKIIPILCKSWDNKPETVTITIKSDGVTFKPAPLPEKH